MLSRTITYRSASDPAYVGAWAANSLDLLATVMAPGKVGGQRPMVASASAASEDRCDPNLSYRTSAGRPRWPGGTYGGDNGYVINPTNARQGGLRSSQRIKDGFRVWDKVVDPCGYKNLDSFTAAYQGDDRTADLTNNGDGKNAVGFLRTAATFDSTCGDSDLVLACTRTRTKNSLPLDKTPRQFEEVDIIFNGGGNTEWWSGVRNCPSSLNYRYDVWQVAVHEVGHAGIGLAHYPDRRTVMKESGNPCGDNDPRSLSLGDARGIRHNYG